MLPKSKNLFLEILSFFQLLTNFKPLWAFLPNMAFSLKVITITIGNIILGHFQQKAISRFSSKVQKNTFWAILILGMYYIVYSIASDIIFSVYLIFRSWPWYMFRFEIHRLGFTWLVDKLPHVSKIDLNGLFIEFMGMLADTSDYKSC